MIATKHICHKLSNGAEMFIRPGQDIEETIARYEEKINGKPRNKYLDNNPKPRIDVEAVQQKHREEWEINVEIARLWFKKNIPAQEIAEILNVPFVHVADFVNSQVEDHRHQRALKDAEEYEPETLAETLEKLRK